MHPLVRQQQKAPICRYDVAALWGMWHATLECSGLLPFHHSTKLETHPGDVNVFVNLCTGDNATLCATPLSPDVSHKTMCLVRESVSWQETFVPISVPLDQLHFYAIWLPGRIPGGTVEELQLSNFEFEPCGKLWMLEVSQTFRIIMFYSDWNFLHALQIRLLWCQCQMLQTQRFTGKVLHKLWSLNVTSDRCVVFFVEMKLGLVCFLYRGQNEILNVLFK